MHDEVARIREVSDLLCSAHALWRDRYRFRAFLLDIGILTISTWLVALTFVDPAIGKRLTPFDLESSIWVGCLSVGVFIATLFQMLTDWKAKAIAHERSLGLFSQVKQTARQAPGALADIETCRRIISQYETATATAFPVPEADFLHAKRRHRIKTEISKYLNDHPGSSILILKCKIWLRDNFGR